MRIIIFIFFFIYACSCNGQKIRLDSKYYLPAEFLKPQRWLNSDSIRQKFRTSDTDILITTVPSGRIPKQLDFLTQFNLHIRQSGLSSLRTLLNLSIAEYKNAFPYLVYFLTDTSTANKVNFDGDPNKINDFQFYKNHLLNSKNLNSVSTRVSFILNDLTGENFAIVRPNSTMAELKFYQNLWIEWINNLKRSANK